MGPALAPPDAVLPDVVLPGVVPPDLVPLLDWLALVPFEVTERDGDADVDGLALVDVVAAGLTFGSDFLVGVGLAVELGPQGVAVALAAVLPAGLVTVAEAAAEGVVVTVLVGVAVVLGVVVGVLVAVVLPPGLALLVVELALVPLLVGLVTVAAGSTLGPADLAALLEGDGEELDEHEGAIARARLLEMLLGLRTPADEAIVWPGPVPAWAVWLLWGEEVSPAAWLSWMKAWRSGGTARATPTANRAQAAASAGRSSPSRQSRG